VFCWELYLLVVHIWPQPQHPFSRNQEWLSCHNLKIFYHADAGSIEPVSPGQTTASAIVFELAITTYLPITSKEYSLVPRLQGKRI